MYKRETGSNAFMFLQQQYKKERLLLQRFHVNNKTVTQDDLNNTAWIRKLFLQHNNKNKSIAEQLKRKLDKQIELIKSLCETVKNELEKQYGKGDCSNLIDEFERHLTNSLQVLTSEKKLINNMINQVNRIKYSAVQFGRNAGQNLVYMKNQIQTQFNSVLKMNGCLNKNGFHQENTQILIDNLIDQYGFSPNQVKFMLKTSKPSYSVEGLTFALAENPNQDNENEIHKHKNVVSKTIRNLYFYLLQSEGKSLKATGVDAMRTLLQQVEWDEEKNPKEPYKVWRMIVNIAKQRKQDYFRSIFSKVRRNKTINDLYNSITYHASLDKGAIDFESQHKGNVINKNYGYLD